MPWDTKASGLYMICTLSKHEAESKGFEDLLMLDHEGNIAEATANIFFKDKQEDPTYTSTILFRSVLQEDV